MSPVQIDSTCGICIYPLSMELSIPLSKKNEPLFRQVYKGLRKAILSGAFRAGGRLPSTRDLAEQLGVSRTVVLLAYDQLLAEGFTEGRSGSGTYVAAGVAVTRGAPAEDLARLHLRRSRAVNCDPEQVIVVNGSQQSPYHLKPPTRTGVLLGYSRL